MEETKEKAKVQCMVLDRLQWYRIEYGKVKCINHDMLDWIVSGGGFFINRVMRNDSEGKIKNVEESPVVETKYPIRWYVTWQHKQALPGFLAYSANCFTRNGMVYRFVDADLKEMETYLGGDYAEFKRIFDAVCEANSKGKLIPMDDYCLLKKILSDGAARVEKMIPGVMYVGYSGQGYRILLRADTKEELEKNVKDAVEKKLLDPCSTDLDYRAMRLNSFQSVKLHFQTDCDPRSLSFRYSNPAFFELPYDKLKSGLDKLLVEYFRSFQKTSTIYRGKNVTYELMRDTQKHIEAQISDLMVAPIAGVAEAAVKTAAVTG